MQYVAVGCTGRQGDRGLTADRLYVEMGPKMRERAELRLLILGREVKRRSASAGPRTQRHILADVSHLRRHCKKVKVWRC
jgi:hypothetical protein